MLLFAWVSSAIIGLSADEYFHHINGLVRYEFLISLGEKKIFEFRNNIIYPGLYDTLSYAISQIIFLINNRSPPLHHSSASDPPKFKLSLGFEE